MTPSAESMAGERISYQRSVGRFMARWASYLVVQTVRFVSVVAAPLLALFIAAAACAPEPGPEVLEGQLVVGSDGSYVLRLDSGEERPLLFARPPNLQTGLRIRVWGDPVAGSFRVRSYEIAGDGSGSHDPPQPVNPR